MKKTNKKGFTLIELLAVIIILGVLMLIAIPSVTEYITNSRKNSYITTVDQYIRSVSQKVNSNAGLVLTNPNTAYMVKVSNRPEHKGCVALESGGTTPFGEWKNAYVIVTFNGNGWNYYFTGYDDGGYGMDPMLQIDLDGSDEPTAAYLSDSKTVKYAYTVSNNPDHKSGTDTDASGNVINANYRTTDSTSALSLPQIAAKAEALENAIEPGISYIQISGKGSSTDGGELTTTGAKIGNENFENLVVITDNNETNNCKYNPYD